MRHLLHEDMSFNAAITKPAHVTTKCAGRHVIIYSVSYHRGLGLDVPQLGNPPRGGLGWRALASEGFGRTRGEAPGRAGLPCRGEPTILGRPQKAGVLQPTLPEALRRFCAPSVAEGLATLD